MYIYTYNTTADDNYYHLEFFSAYVTVFGRINFKFSKMNK